MSIRKCTTVVVIMNSKNFIHPIRLTVGHPTVCRIRNMQSVSYAKHVLRPRYIRLQGLSGEIREIENEIVVHPERKVFFFVFNSFIHSNSIRNVVDAFVRVRDKKVD